MHVDIKIQKMVPSKLDSSQQKSNIQYETTTKPFTTAPNRAEACVASHACLKLHSFSHKIIIIKSSVEYIIDLSEDNYTVTAE